MLFPLIKALLTRQKQLHDTVWCSSGTRSNLHSQFYLVQIIWAERKIKVGPLGQQLQGYSQKAKVNVVFVMVTEVQLPFPKHWHSKEWE